MPHAAVAHLPDARGATAADAGTMRATATWSGTIAFGMVSIPVQLYAATEEHTARLHEIHTADGSRVQHRRFCAAEGREIPYSEVGRGVALSLGEPMLRGASDDDLVQLSASLCRHYWCNRCRAIARSGDALKRAFT